MPSEAGAGSRPNGRAGTRERERAPDGPERRGRREALAAAPCIAAATAAAAHSPLRALAGEASPTYAASNSGVLLTGATSGIGFDAACKLLARGERVFAVCRDEQKAAAFSKSVGALALPGAAVPLVCDLGSLSAVRALATDVASLCGRAGLGALVLNAGVQYSGATGPALRTADGFEVTVGVNHFR